MATYSTAIPALDPLASGNYDKPAAGIAKGEPLQDAHVAAAAQQHKTRKALAKNNPQFVTEDELVASKRRKHLVESANFDGPVPLWGLQMQQTVQQMQEQMQQMQQKMEKMQRQIHQESQRCMNRSRRYTRSPIEALIRLEDGQCPDQQAPNGVWFPADQNELFDADANRINALLEFYSLGAYGTQDEKMARLDQFLGVII